MRAQVQPLTTTRWTWWYALSIEPSESAKSLRNQNLKARSQHFFVFHPILPIECWLERKAKRKTLSRSTKSRFLLLQLWLQLYNHCLDGSTHATSLTTRKKTEQWRTRKKKRRQKKRPLCTCWPAGNTSGATTFIFISVSEKLFLLLPFSSLNSAATNKQTNKQIEEQTQNHSRATISKLVVSRFVFFFFFLVALL